MANTISAVQASRTVIPVFFAVDDHYAPYLAVALRSLIDNASCEYDYRIHILITALSEDNVAHLCGMSTSHVHIQTVDVSEKIRTLSDRLHLRDYYTKATYYRFFIPELFPEYSRALYLDCDIAVCGDISRLYHAPIGDCMLGAVPDDMISDFEVFGDYAETVVGVPRSHYFNAGILVMNLDKMRRYNLNGAFVELLGQKTFRVAQDQDYLNALCYGDVALLERAWNTNAREDIVCECEPFIVHYKINWKPWHYKGIRFEESFWQYADRTPYGPMLYAMRDDYTAQQKARDEEQYQALVALARQETQDARSALPV